MSEERFISRQISKYATTKKLIEFNDKMRLPPVEYYAHVQATGDKNHEGKNVTSLIGITMLDYSNGTGDKTVSVEANITPDELMYIFSKLNQGVEKFEMAQDKIFGESGNSIVIEEFLSGPEVSVLSFTDGKVVVPMVSSMDHKRALDGDLGLNTGGMGTVAPNPYYTKEVAAECMEKIFVPTINAMNKEGRTFKGCLYFGLMLTENGPKVIEYNCRFGDPETQVVLPLLKSDLLDIMMAVSDGELDKVAVEFYDGSACCVVMASDGYPSKYDTGFRIDIDKGLDAEVFVAGAKLKDGETVTSGGRVLGVTAVSDTLKNAVDKAYEAVKKVNFENAYYRHDIGKKALEYCKE